LEGVDRQGLVKLHGIILDYGWIEQNMGSMSVLKLGVIRQCYRIKDEDHAGNGTVHVSRRCWPFSRRSRVDVIVSERGRASSRTSRFKGTAYGIAADAEALGAARHPSVWKLTPRQMSALLFIQDKRKKLESIEFVSNLRLAMAGSKRDLEKRMERWARDAEIDLRFEE
jgi:hypothetical protein